MRLYHRTTKAAAHAIMAGGFRDTTGGYGFDEPVTGVWLSDAPLDAGEGADGDTLLEVDVDLPDDVLAEYDVVEEGFEKGFREFCFPSALINGHCAFRLVSKEEEMAKTCTVVEVVNGYPSSCGRMGVWFHPTDAIWLCEVHAPPVADRGRCVVCGKVGAWRRPDSREWLCREHMPAVII